MKSRNQVILNSLVIATILFGVVIQPGQSFQDPAVKLERAIQVETVDGNLETAIKLYKEIIAENGNHRAIAAKAQLRIGMCYEKLGRKSIKQAQIAFQKVVDNYPTQSEEVKIAKEKLMGFQITDIPPKEEKSEFTIKKIWTGPEADGLGKISPDGRFVAFTDWTTGDLAVLDLTTGKKNRLTNKGNWMKSKEFALFLAWSPDGKQIAYNWWGETRYIDMRVIEATGSKPPRIVHNMKNPESGGAFVIGWTPDGKSVVTAFAEENGLQGWLSLISMENGSERIIKDMDVTSLVYNQVISLDISPDGRWIAYSYPANDKNASNRDIYLISIDGKQNYPLIEHPACDLVIGWLPDGETMLFKSDREGTDDVWAISVKDGKPDGLPVLIKEEIGLITPQGFDRDGSLYYITSPSRENVYTAKWDPISGEILKKPDSPIKHLGQRTYSPSYSPDGKSLAYVSVRGGNPMIKEQHVICIRSLDSGDEREFETEYKPWGRLRWSQDSHSILAYARDGEGQNAHSLICLIDTNSGEVKSVYRGEMDEQKEWVDFVDFSPDGKSFYYLHCDDIKKTSRLLIRNPKNGNEKEMYHLIDSKNFRFRCALSPDGKNFVLQYKTANSNMAMHILPVMGGEMRQLYSTENRKGVTRGFTPVLTWSKDGRYILFSNNVQDQQNSVVPILQLMRISVEGGEPQALDLKMARLGRLSIHPDGETLAFNSLGPSMKMPILWKMENYLPELKRKEK